MCGMFFKNKDKLAFERLSPTERLETFFSNRILTQFNSPDVSYVKSKRCVRFKKDLFHLEIYWEQQGNKSRQTDARFQMRCALFSTPYRKWEKTYYQPMQSRVNTPIDGRRFHQLEAFDSSELVSQRYALNFKSQKKLATVIAKNINLHLTDYFASFEGWDDKAIAMLEDTRHSFRQTVPLVITDFLILQDRPQDAWNYLDTHDQWYKHFIKLEKNGGEGLNHIWGPPYYARKEKLSTLLGLDYTAGKVTPDPDVALKTENERPVYPLSKTREQAREIKARNKAFNDALKEAVKGTAWRFARGTIFKQDGDWFVSNFPSLGYGRGVDMRWTRKPIAIDPLYWEILGLEDNHKQPLSFRSDGVWTIRPIWTEEFIAAEETSPETLANAVIEWSDKQWENEASTTLKTMLADLGPVTPGNKTEAVCLLVLMGKLDEAEQLCRGNDPNDKPALVLVRPGAKKSFYEAALDWIEINKG